MIKVQIKDTIFYCDTPEEAIALHKLSQPEQSESRQSKPVHIQPAVVKKPVITTVNALGQILSKQKKQEVIDFLHSLKQFEGAELDATKMAKVLGADKPHGVGPRLARISRLITIMFPNNRYESFVTKMPGPGGTSIWKIGAVPNV